MQKTVLHGRDDRTKPTAFQIEQCVELLNKLHFDLDWYDLDAMSRSQMQRLIDNLKDVERQARE